MTATVYIHPTALATPETWLQLERDTARVAVVYGNTLQLVSDEDYFAPCGLPDDTPA